MQHKFLLLLLFINLNLISSELYQTFKGTFDSTKDMFKDVIKDVPSQFHKMLESFGLAPSNYAVNFNVINNSNETVYIGLKTVRKIFGANFLCDEAPYDVLSLNPINTTETDQIYKWSKKNLYCKVFFSTNKNASDNYFYSNDYFNLDPIYKNSNYIFYYNIFTDKSFFNNKFTYFPNVELCGVENKKNKNSNSTIISKNLNSVCIFNNTNSKILFSAQNGLLGKQITLDENSFNELNSFSNQSLRPNIFTFQLENNPNSKKSINFAATGINSKYNIEIYQENNELKVCLRGITRGNYDLPVSKRLRNITPVCCSFVYNSIPTNQTNSAINLPGKFYIIYPDEEKLAIKNISPGTTNFEFNFFRPSLNKNYSFIYFFYLQFNSVSEKTNFDLLAQEFFAKFFNNKIGSSFKENYEKLILNFNYKLNLEQNLNKISINNLSSSNRILNTITDEILGLTAYPLGADIFYPNGIKTTNIPSFKYLLGPMEFSNYLNNFLSYIVQFLNNTNLTINQNELNDFLFKKYCSWITLFYSDSASAEKEIKLFLKQNLANTTNLNLVFNLILNYLKNLPIILTPVQNYIA